MQLCTNARIFLDMVAASGQPKLWELTPPEARQKVIELTRMVECEEAIGKIEDRTLPGPPDDFRSAYIRRWRPRMSRQVA
jgi:hypothetical protein